MTQVDVAIVGGGPAGLQAALVLARTRKDVVVFDSPAPPRNAASHGVHNFLGVDGLLPQQIRDRAWEQISVYGSARLVPKPVTSIERTEPDPGPGSGAGGFRLMAGGEWFEASQVLLACGFRDVLPEIDGFRACWANTIIPCPFCDGYENRDRLWGIVTSTDMELDVFPAMVQNWTTRRLVIAPGHLQPSPEQEAALDRLGVPLHRGDIVHIEHVDGKLVGVTLDTGEMIPVETLLWTPDEARVAIITELVETMGLAVDAHGHVSVDEAQRTNIPGLWAAGDVQGWVGAIESANLGGMAATMIVHDWYNAEHRAIA